MRWANPVLCWLLVLSAGCQKLKDERTVQVEPGGTQTLMFDAPRSSQKVTIEISASGAPVNAYLVLDADRAEAEQALLMNKKPAKALASQEKVEQGKLDAAVPAGKSFALLLTSSSGKSAQAKIKTTGR